jgi:hypothetical protein
MTTSNALNISASGLVAFDGTSVFFGRTLTAGSGITITDGDGTLGNPTISATGSGGTVTTLSVVSANGLAGTVANPTTTPAITLSTTITGLLSGNGTAISGSAITQYDVLVGGASNAVSSVGPGTAGQILQSGGNAANPSYSTSTYPSTNAVNTLLYASSANTMAALSTANDGVLITSNTGVPSWLANSGTAGFVLTANSGAPPSWQANSVTQGIVTINGDTGFMTGATVTLFADQSIRNSGATVRFVNSGAVSILNLSDANSNTCLGNVAGGSTMITNGATVNTCVGASAGRALTSGSNNVFAGVGAGQSTLLSTANVAIGGGALTLYTGTALTNNCAVGVNSLGFLLTGAANNCFGQNSGQNYTSSETSNACFVSLGTTGESNVLRLGTQGSGAGQQNTCFIAGITGVTVSSAQMVTINSSTQQMGIATIPTGTVTSVSGTANQVSVATGTTTPVISLVGPYTPSTYTAHGVIIGETTSSLVATAAGTTGQVLTGVTGADPVWAAPATSGTVTSVSGTTNQVAVATGTTTPVISLTGPYTPATYTAHGVLFGEGTSSIVALAAGSAGQHLQSGGASADPSWTTATYPATATSTGTILRADGTNWSATTSTYPNTNAINTLLYASSANVMAALATANSGVLATNSTGVPSIDTTNFAVLSTGLQLKGNNTNTAPPAGFIGEYISSFILQGSAVGLTTTVTANVTSISLTSGIWDVSVLCGFNGTLTTAGTLIKAAISTTSASIPAGSLGNNQGQSPTLPSGNSDSMIVIPSYRMLISGTTTVYLVASATFTVSTVAAYGRISATRVG